MMLTASGNIITKKGKYEIKPNKKVAMKCQELMFQGKQGSKSQTYSLREFVLNELAPTWRSFVWDSVHRDVESKMKAPDPEFGKKARRGWLTIQGARNFPKFNKIGIGCPPATAHPFLNNKDVELLWDNGIGPVSFHLCKLDGGRYSIWNRIRDKADGWGVKTVYITEKDNKLYLNISYERPDPITAIDVNKVMIVRVNPGQINNYITASCDEERFYAEKIDITDALNFLDKIDIVQNRYKVQKNSIKWRRTMGRIVQQKISHQTLKRKNGQTVYNHIWTRRIVNHAIRTRCGIIDFEVPELTMEGRPWGWYQFKTFLDYKMNEIGGILITQEDKEEQKSPSECE